jgi:hypothetical protein
MVGGKKYKRVYDEDFERQREEALREEAPAPAPAPAPKAEPAPVAVAMPQQMEAADDSKDDRIPLDRKLLAVLNSSDDEDFQRSIEFLYNLATEYKSKKVISAGEESEKLNLMIPDEYRIYYTWEDDEPDKRLDKYDTDEVFDIFDTLPFVVMRRERYEREDDDFELQTTHVWLVRKDVFKRRGIKAVKGSGLSGGYNRDFVEQLRQRQRAIAAMTPEEKQEAARQHAQRQMEIQQEIADREKRQEEIQRYNQEMRRRAASPFAPIVKGLTNIADFAVENIAPIVGVPSLVTEAYKTFAPPGSQYYSGTGGLRRFARREYFM